MNTKIVSLILVLLVSVATAQDRSSKEHDDPFARARYNLQRLCDPATGDYPPNIFYREHEFIKRSLPSALEKQPATLANGFDWQCMGPWNQSGRIQSVAIDIINHNNMLAGSASGGMWRSIDGGESWVKVSAPNEQETVSAIIQDTRPGKESNWYYSTSELLSTTDRRHTANIRTHTYGNGLYRSSDNGASWIPITATHSPGTTAASLPFRGVWNLVLDHTASSATILYAACQGGIMRSSDDGDHWSLVLGDTVKPCFNSDIVIGTKGTLYAILGSIFTGESSPFQGLWRSTNGTDWTRIAMSAVSSELPESIRRARLALSQSSDSILYCLTETPEDWSIPDSLFGSTHTLSRYVYLSGNGSGSEMTWESLKAPFNDAVGALDNTSLSGYALVVAVHPTDPDQVLVGNTNLFYSKDGFTTTNYTKIGGYPYSMLKGSLHPDMHCVFFDPANPSQVYAGNDGGVYFLPDISKGNGSWINLDNGLNCAQVYHSSLVQNGTSDKFDFIVSGLQDNSTYFTDSPDPNEPWRVLSSGDGMSTAFSQDGSMVMTSLQYGTLFFTTHNGSAYRPMTQLPPPINLEANFYTIFALEPKNASALYVAEGDHLVRYSDFRTNAEGNKLASEGWKDIVSVNDALTNTSSFLSHLYFDLEGTHLYFGSNTGHIYRLDAPTSQNPKAIDISGVQLPRGYVAGIEQDPFNDQEILVTLSNYNIQSLFRTTNGGTTWQPIGGNLEEFPDGTGSGPSVRCIKILHTSSGPIYYVGTSQGLFSTTKIDGMQTHWVWEGPTTIGNLIVESIDTRNSDGTVIVSTQGGGVFKNVPANSVGNDNNSDALLLRVDQNFPNPFSSSTSIRFSLSERATVKAELFNTLGQPIAIIANDVFEAGPHDLTVTPNQLQDAITSSGNYFLRISSGTVVSTIMMTYKK